MTEIQRTSFRSTEYQAQKLIICPFCKTNCTNEKSYRIYNIHEKDNDIQDQEWEITCPKCEDNFIWRGQEGGQQSIVSVILSVLSVLSVILIAVGIAGLFFM
jgi:hypothetical protein